MKYTFYAVLIYVILCLIFLSFPATAKMTTILKSPEFDWSTVERSSSVEQIAGGLRLLTITDHRSGCIISVIVETGTVISKNQYCNDKYNYEATKPNR